MSAILFFRVYKYLFIALSFRLHPTLDTFKPDITQGSTAQISSLALRATVEVVLQSRSEAMKPIKLIHWLTPKQMSSIVLSSLKWVVHHFTKAN